MKAMVYEKYGPPEVIQLKEVEKPTPRDDEVLVKVHAVGVNASDWEMLRGKPLYARIFGLFKPGKKILGSDIAGRVEAVGQKVKGFKPGDEVYGDIYGHMGGFAEYACAPQNTLLPKPAGITFAEAAALPQSAVLALQGIRDKGRAQAGQKILINGAGGGVGTFAVQLAKHLGAEVTAVDRGEKLDMLRSLGAGHVIDYTGEDFTAGGRRYDLVLDNVANRSIFAYKRALNAGGRYYMVGGSMSTLFQVLLLGPWIRLFSGKKLSLLAVRANTEDLDYMTGLFEAGTVKPVIDKHYPLAEVPAALRYLGEGHAKGKVVITLE